MLTFPQLPGIAFPIDEEFGNFDTTIESAVTGKERRYANIVQARTRRVLSIEGLDSAGAFPSLTAQSLQTLAGFFQQCYGKALAFLYWAPEDNAASAQPFGLGDGATTAFQLTRSRGGWVDAVFAPLQAASPTLIPSATAPNASNANVYAPNNFLSNTAVLATQSVNVTATKMILSFYGTGSIALSGAYSGSLSGTGASSRVSLAFTPSAGTLTLTVSGSVTSAQLEVSTLSTPGPFFATLASPYYGGPWITAGGVLVDPSTYTVSAPGGGSAGGLVTFATAPSSGAALAWTGNFYQLCNWDDDKLALSQFMSGLWSGKSLSFTTRVW